MCHINAKLRELRHDFGVSALLMFDPFLTVFMKFCAISNMMQMNTSRILDLKLSIYSLSLSLVMFIVVWSRSSSHLGSIVLKAAGLVNGPLVRLK